MKKKIIITGGLGYIGTELCRLYSGISWHHNILVIDNRFVSERVSQIRDWGISFIHADIMDQKSMQHLTFSRKGDYVKSVAFNKKNNTFRKGCKKE